MFEISFLGAAFAGLLSFATPCVLPMVPFYLCYLGGLSMSELREDAALPPGVTRRMVIRAMLFAAGVTTVFMLLGLGATALGRLFADWMEPLTYVAAAVLAIFGLHFLGVIRVPLLYREAKMESTAEPTTLLGAYIMGLAFGFGWTPCVGPALASILMIAAGMGDPVQGALLLLVYGIGMTSPFVIAALAARPFLAWVGRNRRLMAHVEKVMGAMLILFAVLIATGSVNWIADQMIRWIPGFATLG